MNYEQLLRWTIKQGCNASKCEREMEKVIVLTKDPIKINGNITGYKKLLNVIRTIDGKWIVSDYNGLRTQEMNDKKIKQSILAWSKE